jgi:hypothetical protein
MPLNDVAEHATYDPYFLLIGSMLLVFAILGAILLVSEISRRLARKRPDPVGDAIIAAVREYGDQLVARSRRTDRDPASTLYERAVATVLVPRIRALGIEVISGERPAGSAHDPSKPVHEIGPSVVTCAECRETDLWEWRHRVGDDSHTIAFMFCPGCGCVVSFHTRRDCPDCLADALGGGTNFFTFLKKKEERVSAPH